MAGKRWRVLLVDDNAEFLRVAARWLAAEPSLELVGSAASGEEALEAVSRLRPDVVLLDLAMPGMGGLAATRALKQSPDAPVVFVISLHESGSAHAEAIAAGADAFVGKSTMMRDVPPLVRVFAGNGLARRPGQPAAPHRPPA